MISSIFSGMLSVIRTKERDAARIIPYRSYDLVRDAVRLARMAPGPVLLGPAAGVAAQAVIIAITWPEWLRVKREVAVLVGVLSRQAHPSVRDVLPAAHGLAFALAVGLAASGLAWVAGAIAMAAPMRRAADRAAAGLTTTVSQSLRRSALGHGHPRPVGGTARLCLITAGCAVIAATLVAAILNILAPTNMVQVRGSILTVVEPAAWSMAASLAAMSVVVVTVLPLGRAVLVTAPAQAAAGDCAPAPAPARRGVRQRRGPFTCAPGPHTDQEAPSSRQRLTTSMTALLSLGATALSAAFVAESRLSRPIADDYPVLR
jgi:hypothetical protein